MKLAEPLHVGGVEIEEVDYRSLTDDQIRLENDLDNVLQAESEPDDPPTPLEAAIAETRNLPSFVSTRVFWGLDADGTLAAQGHVYWHEVAENRHVANAGIGVRPDYRRRGIGRSLLSLLTDAADSVKRPLIMFSTSDRIPAGEIFARHIGAELGLATHTNRLVLSGVDRELVHRWVSEGPARAPEYSVFALDGPYADDRLEAIVDLMNVMNTAPRGDLDLEDRNFTTDQYREWERSWIAEQTQKWGLFARHNASGEFVGYTEVYWTPHQPKTIWQGDTAVRPEHRGHALGKWLKAAMLERIFAERPGAEDVRTGNADSNAPMLGINNELGFEPYIAYTSWQVRTERVRAYLDGSSV